MINYINSAMNKWIMLIYDEKLVLIIVERKNTLNTMVKKDN